MLDRLEAVELEHDLASSFHDRVFLERHGAEVAARIRNEAPQGTVTSVQASPQAVLAGRPRNPFALFGGLAISLARPSGLLGGWYARARGVPRNTPPVHDARLPRRALAPDPPRVGADGGDAVRGTSRDGAGAAVALPAQGSSMRVRWRLFRMVGEEVVDPVQQGAQP